uniref:Kinase n=1 Tax=Oryzias sinensis TaxID=183150 RepID=A0A8C8E3G8_9TELE
MSRTQHHLMMMESSVALGKPDLAPGSAAGLDPVPRSSGGDPGKEPQDPPNLNGCVPLSHQVAGHKFGVDKGGILQHPDGTVLKQVQPPPRGPREMQFYSTVYAEDCCDPCLLDLQNYLPRYYGTWSHPDRPHDLYLKLEDVTRHFVKPCIMDVKLGQQSYDPFASQDKREQQIKKYPLMEEIGFLILGMRVYNMRSDSFCSYDQHYGRGLVKDSVKDGLARFFHNGASVRGDAVLASIWKVRQILHWFQSQRKLAFYASSLLFVYEGLPPSSSPSLPANESAALSLAADAGREEKAVRGETGEGKGVAENNNNTEEAAPRLCSPPTIYNAFMKARDRCSGEGRLHGNIRDGSGSNSGLWEEDNATWQKRGDLKASPNGNQTKSQLEGRDEDRKREEEEEEGGGGEGGRDGTDVEVKMIDFAHVFPSDSCDHGYIFGLKNLLTVLEQILCDATTS